MAHLNLTDLRKVQDALSPNADVATVAAAIAILTTAADHTASAALREAAHEKHGTDDVEIDDEPATSEADDGTWVAAWVWVPHPECTACEGDGVTGDDDDDCEACSGAGTVAL